MRIWFIISSLFIFSYCSENNSKTGKKINYNEQALKNQFVEANKLVVQKENDEMDYYAKSHKMDFVKTTSGIRYYVYNPSPKGDSIKNNTTVSISFTLSLLNGTTCYSSDEEGKKTIRVGQENVESGLHKALTFLKTGDQALILIPSHLAHGLMGDMKKIPPQMPIVYDIQID
ncbi:MAG: FKBP-type peptidyl-prolyl cis-trans isomerase [Sphingobacteriaceae bacterium]|nr:FKBP-type peptidyl-prolyl cis-trans isomerase [Sphingobacteriaceae bacterium]